MKKLKMFLAGLLAMSLLVSCSDDEGKKKPDNPPTPPEPVTVEKVTFTPAAGEVASGTQVALATATEGATIYYGFAEDAVTTEYDANNKPALTEAVTIYAVAKKGDVSSELTSAAYTIEVPTPVPEDANDIKDGLKENVTAYWVSDVAGLQKLSELVNGGNALAGYTFVVKNDIQINKNVVQAKFLEPEEGDGATPNAKYVNLDSIGTGKKTAFSGTFDGNNKVIDGFYAYQAHQGLGFFGCISGAKIKNVILTNACVINSNASEAVDGEDDDRFGGLVGVAAGESTIKDCVFTGVVGSAVAKARNEVNIPDGGKAGSYEYLDGFVGRADAKVTTSGCIVFARAYGTPSIKVAIDGDVTKIDAATYTEGAYTGDNAYVLAAIALLNKEPLTVAKAVFTTAAGEVAYGTAVEITCETEGAEILYKVGDGEYAAYDAANKPVVKAESVTITAYTVLRDENNEVLVQSAAETVTYTVAAPAAPVIDPNGGEFVTGNPQTVTITTETAGAFVAYKFGEVSENTADYTVYDADNKPVVSATSTIVAVAVIGEEGAYITSDPVTAAFTFTDPAKPNTPAPVIASEAVVGGYTVTITCTDTAAAIYYSTAAFTAEDIASATAYTAPFDVTDTATIYALSVKDGENAGSASLEITVPEVTLTIAPEAGKYLADTEITITADDGATITYSTDGENFAAYDAANKPKVIAGTVTAKAEKAGCKSATATAAYTLKVAPGEPYATTKVGEVDKGVKLRFYADGTEENSGAEDGEKGAFVYYQFVAEGGTSTLSAENYAEEGTLYTGSIKASESGTYYCIAVNDGLVSAIKSFSYTVILPAGRAVGLEAAATKIGAMTHDAATESLTDVNTLTEAPTEGTYKVTDADGLDKIAAWVTDGKTLAGVTIVQAADIAFNANAILNSEFVAESVEGLRVFAGIGTKGKPFAGTYDGNGYKISHMYIYAAHSELAFVCNTNATTVLNNIILDDVYVLPSNEGDSSDDRAGGLIGKVTAAGTTINNCVVIGAVGNQANVDAYNAAANAGTYDKTKDGKPEHFGGLVGGCDKAATATDCLVVARVTAYQGFGVVVASTKDNLTKTNVAAYDASIE